ncbi:MULTISPECIES: YicC/YloC family endoribonuclease [Peptoniphilus]|uniref:YicC/YloC family endoribonuclease n=1 Tax=Peptoniphilus TaxID=162289 RepID=UPI000287C46F|nr:MULTISPECIES: YicC/YloC family endoribonuclease [Peptoniphilus]MBS6610223.1 YicC family protein [Peptoniphilus harei]MDU1043285.1 YicC/YloC family endoribonuclease [Peptoniphilus rhinitidis]MDU2110423.1 YicC/YloC family endoribonuclease [Peptoniphilus lacydonensis]MDU3750993.1 YicC/YloC family endoribonuclease [Peptoniphilus rhinitidis]MDU5377903.1 YicC/YloC family endoribonuclease [Peptoniphilus lacydonensis]
MNSMTGYGLFEKRSDDFYIKVEMKSVNNRYLDINMRMSNSLIYAEESVKSLIKSKIKRGKVDVFINFECLNSEDVKIDVDYKLLNKYIIISKDLEKNFGVKSDISFLELMRDPNIFKSQKDDFEVDLVKKELLEVAEKSLNNLVVSRQIEGKEIKKDFKKKLSEIKKLTDFVEKRAPITLKENEERLRNRISEYLDATKIDESRILTEIAIILDKLSIDEEITRLKIHIDNFNDIIESEESIGRKLDFLIQEMNREVNTIGSKSNDIEITNTVVKLKSEIEKLREQVQNVE